jgi:hypothetical protein
MQVPHYLGEEPKSDALANALRCQLPLVADTAACEFHIEALLQGFISTESGSL